MYVCTLGEATCIVVQVGTNLTLENTLAFIQSQQWMRNVLEAQLTLQY